MMLTVEGRTLYRCDGCGKTRDYLSESWSETTIVTKLDFTTSPAGIAESHLEHRCLECRSDKKEHTP